MASGVLARVGCLADVDLLASAVENLCQRHDASFHRVNVEILGSADAFLHAHIRTRYEGEPAALLKKPGWLNPPENGPTRVTHWVQPMTG